MMKKIFTRSFIAVALVAVVGFVSSCKDYNDEIMAEYRGEDAKLEDLIDNLDGLLSDLKKQHNQDIKDAKDARDAMQTTLEGLINTVKSNQALKDEGQSDSIKWAVDSIGKLDARIATLEGRVKAIEDLNADNRLKALEDIEAGQRLDSVEKVLGALQHAVGDSAAIVTWTSNIQSLQSDVATAKGNHESLTKRLESMQNSITTIESCAVDCEALDSLVKEMGKSVDSLAVVTAEMNKTVEKLNRSVERMSVRIFSLEGKVTSLQNAVAAIEKAYQEADKVLADSIAAVRADLTKLEKRVKANEDAIKKLVNRVDKIENALEARISNILVQGAYSPVVGYFNMPLGIKSNILASYKGEVIEDMSFPFGFIDGEINSLISLQSSLDYDGETFSELTDGKAGKLYLTINPAEVNLDSVDFALVNSQNELAPVKLDSVVVSSDVLKFGYTRAGAPLYEATATITDAAKASLDLNLSDYKDILSDLKGGNINLTDIAGTLYSSINDIADANAVRASWTDSLGKHTVYSDFAVAAVAVKPLSYNFLADLNVQNIPGITRVHRFIDRAFEKVNIALPSFDGLNFTAPTIAKIEIPELKDEGQFELEIVIDTKVDYLLNMEVSVDDVKVEDLNGVTDKIEVTVPEKTHTVVLDGNEQELTIPEYKIEVPSSNFIVTGPTIQIKDIKIEKNLQIPVKFTHKENIYDIVNELYGDIVGPIEDVNEMLGDLEAFMDDVNKMLDELQKVQDLEDSIEDAINGVNGQLHKYLDKFNNKLCGVINSFNDKLQPAMFVKTTDDFGMLSQSKNLPTIIENSTVLVPTSYTAEYLAPAFKKYVAITAVNGSTDNLAAINAAAGERLNKVLDGDVRAISFKGESGNTYEITYSALDYAGMVVNTKYYVTVK